MIRVFMLVFLLTFHFLGDAQKVSLKVVNEKLKRGQVPTCEDVGFKEYKVFANNDTVIFYTYQKPNSNPSSIYLTLPGSNAEAIYTYHKDTDSAYWFSSLTSFDFSYLPDNYLLVIVAKPGFGFFGNGDSDTIPSLYWNKTSLQDRVTRADIAIKYVKKNIIKKPAKAVIFGYSEGFYVGAKLATVNKTITHLGIGGGGGYIDFYDFVLTNQKALIKGEIKADTAIQNNEKIISVLRQIMSKPNSTNFRYGYTYKRWASFAEPPIQNLVKVNIPIFQIHGGNDESTAIENAYVVPIEFARLNKNNLTFKVYPNSDHSLIEHKADGSEISHWNEMMKDFFNWVTAHVK